MTSATLRLVPAFALLALLVLPASAAAQRGGGGSQPQLVITRATMAPDEVTIDIHGTNFGTAVPTVWLNGQLLLVQSSTPTDIQAVLAAPLNAASYRVIVARGTSAAEMDDFEITVGAVGPQGPPGTIDLPLLDARYAPIAHGHFVGQIAGAATLGANSFAGNQQVTGNLDVTGQIAGSTGTLANSGSGPTLSVQKAGADNAFFATTTSAGHAAVFGRNLSSAGAGLRGEAGAHGVVGLASSTTGTEVEGVLGWATGTSGTNVGVRGRTDSPTGIGGVFENSTGGNLILGRVGFTERFRVDGAGTVFASSYRDLAGNPIGGAGDITGVAAGAGLTGGGSSGDVSLALDTAFTDARYAAAAHGHGVSQVTGAATLAANTFSGTQTINTGNLDLDPSTAAAGNITKNGTRFLHTFGNSNMFLGLDSGNFNMTGILNVGIGRLTLFANALGGANTAIGEGVLQTNTDGHSNTAVGAGAMVDNTVGHSNVAAGTNALLHNDTGAFNVALGYAAGAQATTGSHNIYLGAHVQGVAGESNTMRLGNSQNRAFIMGVRGVTTVSPDAIPVMIDSQGQLGTVSSSIRFKEDVQDMGDASRRLFDLRPVTFRYRQPFGDGSKPLQFGLVAEEVAEAFPELAVRSAAGDVETVHYERLSALLLNELQRQQRRLDVLEAQLTELLRQN